MKLITKMALQKLASAKEYSANQLTTIPPDPFIAAPIDPVKVSKFLKLQEIASQHGDVLWSNNGMVQAPPAAPAELSMPSLDSAEFSRLKKVLEQTRRPGVAQAVRPAIKIPKIN